MLDDLIQQIDSQAAAIAAGIEELKRRSLVYQHDCKMRACAALGLTMCEVNIAYPEWELIRNEYLKTPDAYI